jgi:hypothetical protein
MRNYYIRLKPAAKQNRSSMICVLRAINSSFTPQDENLLLEDIMSKYQAIEISPDDFVDLMVEVMDNKSLASAVDTCLVINTQEIKSYIPSENGHKSVNISQIGIKS